MEGGSIYDLYTYEYAGVNPETGAAQWYMDEKDANGKVTGRTVTEDYTQASKYELGSTLPDFQGGFQLICIQRNRSFYSYKLSNWWKDI